MTRAEVTELVSRLSYKQGWELEADFDETRGTAHLDIRVKLPDVRNPAVPVEVGYMHLLGNLKHLSRQSLLDRVSFALREMEEHEFCEWFRLDGRPVRNPHPEGPKRSSQPRADRPELGEAVRRLLRPLEEVGCFVEGCEGKLSERHHSTYRVGCSGDPSHIYNKESLVDLAPVVIAEVERRMEAES